MPHASASPTTQNGRATCRDGTQLAYTVRSTGADRPRIALIHSLAMDVNFWAPVAELLAPVMDVLTYDCRGHGASDKPAGPYTNALFVRDLTEVLDHLGWDKVHVAGASMGGSVALGFAATCPERTEGLGLIDTTAWYGAEAPKNWSERAAKARADGMQALVGFQQKRWFCDDFRVKNPAVLTQCIDIFLHSDITAFEATCQMLGTYDLRPVLPGLSVKTVVAVGEEDYATPIAMAEVLHQGIRGSSIEIIPNARHLTPLECPQKVAAILLRLPQAACADVGTKPLGDAIAV